MRQPLRAAIHAARLLAALGALAALAPAAHAQAVTTQLWLPFPSTATLNGETVGFTGAVHVVVRVHPTDPCRIHTNLVDVVGIGQTTGATYPVTGAASFASDDAPPGTYVFDAAYPTDPTRQFIRLRHSVSVDAAGAVTSASVAIAPPGDVEGLP